MIAPSSAVVPGASVGAPPPGRTAPARVLIVDDSLVARTVLGRMIDADDRLTVGAAVASAAAALEALASEAFDAIVLDLEMPDVDGLTALPALLARGGGAPVLIVSSGVDAGAQATVSALAMGAADTLVKPGAGSFAGTFGATLVDKLRRLTDRPAAPPAIDRAATSPAGASFDILAIGGSTGGIHALAQVLAAIPASMQQPIVVTQHLPTTFSSFFAAQVATFARRPCDVATDRMRLRPGRVVVAPGNAHLTLVPVRGGESAIRLSTEPVTSGCLPSVDPMLRSVGEVYGERALAVVLSGMGKDGLEGARSLRAAGGAVLVQDRDSSVVWGMPGAIAAAGLASAMLTPEAIGRLVAGGRRPAW